MLADDYAQTLIGLHNDHDKKELKGLLDRFIALLKERGHIKLLPQIVRSYEQKKQAFSKQTDAVVRVAREKDTKKFASSIKEQLSAIDASEHSVVVDEKIVGGFIVESSQALVDNSYRKSLLTLYRSFIS